MSFYEFKGKGGGLKATLIAIFKSAVCRVKRSRGRDGGEMCPHKVM